MHNTRLKTSKRTASKIDEIHRVLKLSSKAAIARIAIGLSLQDPSDPRVDYESVLDDNSGFELQRSTLFGNFEGIYRALLAEHLYSNVSESEYFPNLIKAHIERGIYLLYSEFRMAGNKDNLISHLLGRLS